MFPSCKINTKINNTHEKCLRLVCSDKRSSSKELLEKDGSLYIHHKKSKYLQRKCAKSKMIYHQRL